MLLALAAPLLFRTIVGTSVERSVISSAGCGKPLPSCVEAGKSKNLSISSSSGVSPRHYRLAISASYENGDAYDNKTPVPLILSFHGRNKDAKFQEELSQFSNTSAYDFRGIVAYPEGVPTSKGTQQWQGDPDSHNISDITFTMELLDHLLNTYCIDTTRIYANGKSNGGGFTGLLACDGTATERIAAFAPVSGAFYLDPGTQELPPCTPTTSRKFIPILDTHGWKDTTIRYLGGPNDRKDGNTTSIPKYMRAWARRDGYDADTDAVKSTLCEGDNGKLVTKWTWGDADFQEVVTHYNYSNLKHNWPGYRLNADTGMDEDLTTCKEADGTAIILEWFGKWTLGV